MRFSLILLLAGVLPGSPASPLYVRAYTLLPEPQQVTLRGGDFEIGGSWHIQRSHGVADDDAAPDILKQELAERCNLILGSSGAHVIELLIRSGAVTPAHATDRDTTAIAAQA